MPTIQKESSTGYFRISISLFFSVLLLCCFLAATLFFVISLVVAVQAIRLPTGGIQIQATIVNKVRKTYSWPAASRAETPTSSSNRCDRAGGFRRFDYRQLWYRRKAGI